MKYHTVEFLLCDRRKSVPAQVRGNSTLGSGNAAPSFVFQVIINLLLEATTLSTCILIMPINFMVGLYFDVVLLESLDKKETPWEQASFLPVLLHL